MLKKSVSFLVCLFLLLAIVGCEEKPGVQNEVQVIPKVDMQGYECVILQDLTVENSFRYKEGTLFADTALDRMAKVAEEYNCKIGLDFQGTEGTLVKYITSKLAVGDYIGEIFYSMDGNVASNVSYAGYLYPLTDVKMFLDYSNGEKYGGANILEVSMLNNIPYTVSPMMWPEKQSSWVTYVVAANTDLLKKHNFSDPREYIEKKNWTWDTFEQCIKDMTVIDGENKIYSLHSFPQFLTKNATLSNGISGIAEIDGQVKTDIYEQASIDALNWVKKLFTDYSDNIDTKGTTWDESIEGFLNNESMMVMTATGMLTRYLIYDLKSEFAVMPFPCGPNGTYGRWSGIFEASEGAGIFLNANEPEYAAQVISALFEPFEGLETSEKLLDYYAEKVFFTRQDAQIYLDMGKYARYSYWTVGGDDYWSGIGSEILNKTGAELVAKYGSKLEKVVEKYISTNYEYMSENLYKN